MVEHGALLGVGEDQIVVCSIRGALEVAAQPVAHRTGEGTGAGAAAGLRRDPVATHVVAAHADLARFPVDVAPAQGEQLALAQPGHRGGHEEGVVGGPEWLGGQVDCAEKGGQLGLVQEADIRARLHDRRVDELARVLTAPPFLLPKTKTWLRSVNALPIVLGALPSLRILARSASTCSGLTACSWRSPSGGRRRCVLS